MPDDFEQQLGPRIADALETKADAARFPSAPELAGNARRRVRRRRQTLIAAAAAVVVAAGIGGVWSVAGGPSPVETATSGGAAESDTRDLVPEPAGACPPKHPALAADGNPAPAAEAGLDLSTPVSGVQVCRYRLTPGSSTVMASARHDAATARQIVDAIKILPERNPDLPVFKCVPAQARAAEAIVLRFDTAQGVREVWVQYDGCADAGFFTGTRTYGLYPAPLKLFMVGPVRPTDATYLDHLDGW